MFLKNPEPAHGTVCIPVPHFHPLHCSLPLPRTPFSHSITLPPIFFFPARRLQDPKISSPPHTLLQSQLGLHPVSPGSPGSPPLTCGVGTRLCSAPCAPPGPAEGVYKGPGRNFWKVGKTLSKMPGRERKGRIRPSSLPAGRQWQGMPAPRRRRGVGMDGGTRVPGAAPARSSLSPACPLPEPSQPLQQEHGELFPAQTVLLPFYRTLVHLISILSLFLTSPAAGWLLAAKAGSDILVFLFLGCYPSYEVRSGAKGFKPRLEQSQAASV